MVDLFFLRNVPRQQSFEHSPTKKPVAKRPSVDSKPDFEYDLPAYDQNVFESASDSFGGRAPTPTQRPKKEVVASGFDNSYDTSGILTSP